MSTRANIIIKDNNSKLFFYRHSDGYPEGTMPTLEKFLNLVKEKRIRSNVNQASGWLILIGAEEYGKSLKSLRENPADINMINWEVGAYEPTTGIHGDIDYLYIIDLGNLSIKIIEENFEQYE